MENIKPVIIIQESEASYYPELRKRLDIKKGVDEIPSLFCDSDILNVNGNRTYFVDVECKKIRYIITLEEVEPIEKEMLTHFWSENFKNYFTEVESDWSVFDNLKMGLAYRGGKGYVYAIWEYNNKSN